MKVLAAAGGNPDTWPVLAEEQFDFFVGIDRGCLYLLEHNLPLDLAVGDFDSLTSDEKAQVKTQAKAVKESIPEKDDTDTQLALVEIFKKDPEACVTLIGATGGRLDHLLAVIFLGIEPRFVPFSQQLIIKDQQNTLSYLNPGEHTIKREKVMKYLAYCCLTPVKDLTLRKSKYTLEHADISYPISYASNEFLENDAEVSFTEGIIAVIQSRDKN